MGFFSRVKALFSGFLGSTADKIEAKNPQLLINDAEQKIQKSRKEAQKQLVDIQTWAEMVRMDMKEAEIRLSDVRIKIDMAAKERDKKLLTELFIMEEELTAELEEKRRLHSSAVEEAIRIRDNYKRFESDMNSRLRELAVIKSQSQIVAMREKIADIDYHYGNHQDDNINTIRRSLNERCARVTAMQQLREDSLEAGINRITNKMTIERAEAKAVAMLNECASEN
ncbi:MAG: hypothetical protein KIC77_10160 [Clostridiales bacterium]|jgi:phage shock protein A, pspA|nr:hypothetical protein [Clostridiales bacterium]